MLNQFKIKRIKMKLFKILFIFLAISPLIFGQDNENKKVFFKTFQVKENDKLDIQNEYGDIKIETWDKNIIEIKVTLTVNNQNKKNQKQILLDSIDFKQINEIVSAKIISNKTCCNNGQKRIDFEVKMPKKNAVELKNEYGDIKLGEHKAPIKIDLEYGSVNCNFPINEISLKLEYGKAYLKNVNFLETKSNYSEIEAENVVSSNVKCDYCSIRVNEITETANFKMDYSKIKVNKLGEKFKEFNFKGDYNDIRMEVEENTNLCYNFEGSYSHFKVEKNPEDQYLKQSLQNNQPIKINIGVSTTPKITILSDYTNVKISNL